MTSNSAASETSFDKLLNFRDSCATVNSFSHKAIVKPRLLYRSARPDSATETDRMRLSEEFGIRTVIDLRSRTEHIEADKKFKRDQAAQAYASNYGTQSSSQIPATRTIAVNLNGKGFERHLVWKLGYLDLIKLVLLMIVGYRLQAISILGRNVLQPRGLNGLAKDTIDHSKPEIKEAFNTLSDPDAYPVLIHCTQGKDRTGLIVLLLLMLCNVPVDAISHDYMLSETELLPEFDERMKEITSIGLDESFARCAPDFARNVSEYIIDTYGGVEQYLEQAGISDKQSKAIKSFMIG